jgi:hypothetical protein
MQEKIYTYSEDFFMIAFFTLRARGVSTMVLIASGGVTPAGGAVPTTAMVTIPVAVVSGSAPTSWRLGSGGEAYGLHKDNVSMQQYRYMTTQQGRTTPRPCRTKGRVSVNSTDGPWELFLLACPSASLSVKGLPPRFGCGAGEKVVWSRDVGLWWIAPVQLCVSLQKIYS